MDDSGDNPMNHPVEQPTGSDGSPKFGRLFIILLCAVLAMAALAFISESFYS